MTPASSPVLEDIPIHYLRPPPGFEDEDDAIMWYEDYVNQEDLVWMHQRTKLSIIVM